jgi:ATP-dependent DNA helicase RecQ
VAKVVLTTPRWLSRDPVLRALARTGVSLVLVLEAQAVSALSAAFSPAHARLSLHLERLGKPPAFAFAPGASAEIRHDIAEALLPGAPQVIAGVVLSTAVSLGDERYPREARRRALCDAAQRLPKPMLVLCATPQETDAAYDTLRSLGLPTHRYHEEMRAGVRAAEQLEFSMPGEESILVATSAFAPSATPHDEDPDGVPLRYGRRTGKADIRSLVRYDPPASLEQLVDELSLLGKDGKGGHAVVLHDPSDRSPVEARTDATRPSGEQIMLMARALESMASDGAITTEALALAARSSRRAVESLADLLDGMGLVTHRDGWLTRLLPESIVLKELRGLAERYATVRVLDTRRLGAVLDLLARPGCKTAGLRRACGDVTAKDCGICATCKGEDTPAAAQQARHAPARRFSVQTVSDRSNAAGTFHADERVANHSRLTAKLADFSR